MHKGYSRLQIGFHWTVAGLLVANYLLAGSMSRAFRDLLEGVVPALDAGALAHIAIGLTVLVLMLARLSLRLRRPVEPAPVPMAWMRWAATATHWAFYATLILLPMSGFVAWFAQARGAASAHETLFVVLLVVAAIHVGAALVHQFVLRDRLIRRMMRPDTQAEPPAR